jgi:hypothetical protein
MAPRRTVPGLTKQRALVMLRANLYNAGGALAVVGEEELALDALQRAIGAGLAGGDWIPQDPNWERLRDHPRFQALVERLARRQQGL